MSQFRRRRPFKLFSFATRTVAVGLGCLAGAGCMITNEVGGVGQRPNKAPLSSAELAQRTQNKKQLEAEKKARALETARLQLALAEQEVAMDAEASEQEVHEARFAFEQAGRALERFRQVSRSIALDKAQLELDRAATDAQESAQELQQMEALYAAEKNLDKSGELTRDLVLARHRDGLLYAKRELALKQRALVDLEQGELSSEERELTEKMRAAEQALAAAEKAAQRAKLERELKLREARDKIWEIENDVEGAEETEAAHPAASGAGTRPDKSADGAGAKQAAEASNQAPGGASIDRRSPWAKGSYQGTQR